MAYNIKSIKEEFKKKGIFYTPKELALYIKSFLPIDIKEVYDPTCGDGGLLEVFDDEVVKYGQEINEEQLKIAHERLINFIGYCGDTLKEDGFKNKRFDYIVANPPFSIEWEPNIDDERFNIAPGLAPKSKADYAFILHILSKLSDKGKAVILEFPGILYRGNSEGKIRKWLIENNYIEKVVAIPGDKFVDTKIATCIIVLNKNKINTDILFIDEQLKKEKAVSLNEIKKNDYNLSINCYVREEKKEEQINELELQILARKQFIKKLRADLEQDKMICELSGFNFKTYLEELKNVINEYEIM